MNKLTNAIKENNSSLSFLLRQLRGRESLRHASNRIGISHNYLSNLEKGLDPRTGKVIFPSPEILKKISKAYNYSYESIMELAGYSSKDQKTITINLQEILEKGGPVTWGEKYIDDRTIDKIKTLIATIIE